MELVGITDVGQVRKENEDDFLVDERLGLFVVADGMGGYSHGAWCSHTAVKIIHEVMRQAKSIRMSPTDRLRYAIGSAGIEIARRAEAEESSMGTTVVALLQDADELHVLHAGDSRAYRFRTGRLERMTTDHSFVEQLVTAGLITTQQARVHPQRNLITRALGQRELVEIDHSTSTIEPGDVWLLCSDGLSGPVNDDEITVALLEPTLEESAEHLVALANERGGEDNITLVAVRF